MRCRPYMNLTNSSAPALVDMPGGNVPQTAWVSHAGNVIIEKQGAYQGNLRTFWSDMCFECFVV